ncbi:MAG: hypothetical protein JW795_08035 [Chitinivibrionales bacterium]|nr:hypothetical protein [Chitinivibrionales bacterium]
MHKRLTQEEIHQFQTTVYSYFHRHQRTLAWRTTFEPYHILVSEIMLQQTQVDRVIPKFSLFIQLFPTLESCGQAPTSDILAAWQGLGYNRRALMLQRCCQTILHNHNGMIPDEPQILETLPGIGKATAASICAFAFNKPVVFIETNIRTVFIHHFFKNTATITDNDVQPLVEQTLDRKQSRKWYSALMDYGTYLKKTNPNPGRKSAHHVKQSPFEGSHRQKRGAVLRTMLKHKQLSLKMLCKEVAQKPAEVQAIADELVREGFLIKRSSKYQLPS